MLGASSSLPTTSADAPPPAAVQIPPSTSMPGFAAPEDSERIGGGVGGAGNRWPREETLALLKFRFDMDAAFRDSSLKGPLWEQVSRKMAELGFQRSAKKCKEKFENVYKYHKRTKDGRASKSDGKTYRFFDQLEALDNVPPPSAAQPQPLRPPQPQPLPPPIPTAVTAALPINSSPHFRPTAMDAPIPPQIHTSHQPENLSPDSTSSPSSTSSDEDIQRRRGKKRKWKDFFQKLMREVIQKQEDMLKNFMEALEKRERDRMARDESRRAQDIARLNREHEILAQERSMATAKDAAVVAFLQKISDQHNLQIPITPPPMPPPPQQQQQSTMPPPPIPAPPVSTLIPRDPRGGHSTISTGAGTSSSRWPKSEVQALIQLRMNLELKYQESGPKGPLWEEISAEMAKLGYSRSAKRCKEKWENINKYFKKVKESNKKRPEDSKTCPYYHLLDAIYKEKAKNETPALNLVMPENQMAPIMARPEQQWPHDSAMQGQDDEYKESGNEDDDYAEDEDDEGGGDYEIVTNPGQQPAANADCGGGN